MNEEEGIIEETTPPRHVHTAVSVYGQQSALDDFPVLKAFQTYLNAEQAKAHKRLMTVSLVFTALTLTVTGVFLYIIAHLMNGEPANDAAMKALSESNAALQKQVLDQTVKMNNQLMEKISEQARSAASEGDAELLKRNMELETRLKTLEIEARLKAERDAEEAARPKPTMSDAEKVAKERELAQRETDQRARAEKLLELQKRLQAENERLKQMQKRLQRQSLYPEYFDENGVEHSTPVRQTARPAAATVAPAAVPARQSAPKAASRTASKPAPRAVAPADPRPQPAPADTLDASGGFDDTDDVDDLDDILPPLDEDGDSVSIDMGDGAAKWTIPLE